MSVHKRFTNKAKTKFSWGYWATVPSNKFDALGNPIRKQVTKFGFATKKEALKAEKEFLANLEAGKIELNKNATFNDVMQFFFDYTEKEGKYAKGTIHLSASMSAILRWHIQEYNIQAGLLFKDSNDKPVSAKWVSRKFKKLLNLNGYSEDYCRVHDLRGQYVDIMHSCGVPTEYISREVGHSNTATTSNIYTQILKEVPIEASRRMDEKLFS